MANFSSHLATLKSWLEYCHCKNRPRYYKAPNRKISNRRCRRRCMRVLTIPSKVVLISRLVIGIDVAHFYDFYFSYREQHNPRCLVKKNTSEDSEHNAAQANLLDFRYQFHMSCYQISEFSFEFMMVRLQFKYLQMVSFCSAMHMLEIIKLNTNLRSGRPVARARASATHQLQSNELGLVIQFLMRLI